MQGGGAKAVSADTARIKPVQSGPSAVSPLAAFLPSDDKPALTRAFVRRAPLFIHSRGGPDLDPALFSETLHALSSTPRPGNNGCLCPYSLLPQSLSLLRFLSERVC